MSKSKATVFSQSMNGATMSNDKGGAVHPVRVLFPRHEKTISQIPASSNSSALLQQPSTGNSKNGNLGGKTKSHEAGQILLAPHVYVTPRKDSKTYSGDILGMAHYWPAIVVKRFVSNYLCVPIHSFNGRGPSVTDAAGRKEYMYITNDGKLTPSLERIGIDTTRVLAVKSFDTNYSQLSFMPKEGATITLACHFDLPSTISYQLLGSITPASLEKLLQFYSELHGFNQSHLDREMQLANDLRQARLTSGALSAAVQYISSERDCLQAEMIGKTEEIRRAEVLNKANTALTESNAALVKKNSALNGKIESVRKHRRAEFQAWKSNKDKMAKRIESQKDTIALRDEAINNEKAANEELTTTVQSQQATIVTQAADLAKKQSMAHVSQRLIDVQKLLIEEFEGHEQSIKNTSQKTIDAQQLIIGELGWYNEHRRVDSGAEHVVMESPQRDQTSHGDLQELIALKDQEIECLNTEIERLKTVVQEKEREIAELEQKLDGAAISAEEDVDEENKSHGKLFSFSSFLGAR